MRETNHTGTALQKLREAAGMTQRGLAEAAGVSVSYLSRAETGQVTPTSKWVHQITASIGKHIEDAKKHAA